MNSPFSVMALMQFVVSLRQNWLILNITSFTSSVKLSLYIVFLKSIFMVQRSYSHHMC